MGSVYVIPLISSIYDNKCLFKTFWGKQKHDSNSFNFCSITVIIFIISASNIYDLKHMVLLKTILKTKCTNPNKSCVLKVISSTFAKTKGIMFIFQCLLPTTDNPNVQNLLSQQIIHFVCDLQTRQTWDPLWQQQTAAPPAGCTCSLCSTVIASSIHTTSLLLPHCVLTLPRPY